MTEVFLEEIVENANREGILYEQLGHLVWACKVEFEASL
jgi:hypothetical protein